MKEIIITLDILNQIRLAKASEATGKTNDELIVTAFENFLSPEGSNNLSDGHRRQRTEAA